VDRKKLTKNTARLLQGPQNDAIIYSEDSFILLSYNLSYITTFAHTFKLDFSFPCSKLVCLSEEDDAVIENGSCELMIDRKNCQIYRVE